MRTKIALLLACAGGVAAAACGSAVAAESPQGFDINIGGDAYFDAGYIKQQGDVGQSNYVFTNRYRLLVTAENKADNGLDYGAKVRIRAYASTGVMDIDQAYIFASGNFGAIEAGTVEGPFSRQSVEAPTNFGTGGVDGDWNEAAGWILNQTTFMEPYPGGGNVGVTGDAYSIRSNRIVYYTPNLLGESADDKFFGGISFSPVQGAVLTGVDRTRITNNNAALQQNLNAYMNWYEAIARYEGTVEGVSILSSVAYTGAKTKSDVTAGVQQGYYDLGAWQAGLQLGYAGFLIGGSYVNAGKSAYSKSPTLYLADQYTWTAGISYANGPISVGFNYEFGHDAGDPTVPGDRTGAMWSVGATYTVAPGLTTSLEYLNSSTRNERGTTLTKAQSGNADLVLVKTMVTF